MSEQAKTETAVCRHSFRATILHRSDLMPWTTCDQCGRVNSDPIHEPAAQPAAAQAEEIPEQQAPSPVAPGESQAIPHDHHDGQGPCYYVHQPGEYERPDPHSINCIHCPHVLQYHLSGVLEGTKRGCTQCDCPGFEAAPDMAEVSPDSPEADERRKHPHYQLLQRLDDFLHKLCEDQRYKQEATQLHGEVHDAAFWFVTRHERPEPQGQDMLLANELVEIGVQLGIISGNDFYTGPQLLVIGRDIKAALTSCREERDRLKDAIYWADGQRGEFRARGPKEGAYWWRKELMARAALKPVSDRQPEGEKP